MGDFVPTKASLNRENVEKQHQFVEFQTYKKKLSNKLKDEREDGSNEAAEETNPRRTKKQEMRRLTHEIKKFGASGFDDKKSKRMEMQMLIELGAKAPKNRKKNYTLILAEKKLEKHREIKKKKLAKFASGIDNDRLAVMKNKSKQLSAKQKKNDQILQAYGKVQVESKKVKKKRR